MAFFYIVGLVELFQELVTGKEVDKKKKKKQLGENCQKRASSLVKLVSSPTDYIIN